MLVLGNLGVLAYAAWPSSAEAPPLGQPPLASSRLVLVVHGLGDSADAWPSKVTGAMSAARPSEQGWLLHAYDRLRG